MAKVFNLVRAFYLRKFSFQEKLEIYIFKYKIEKTEEQDS